MLTQIRLKELFDYDPGRGVLLKKIQHGKHKVGDVVGNYNKGYLHTYAGGEYHLVHRIIWLYVYGAWPKQDIDHINGIKDDNRIVNLRDVSRTINKQNSKRAQRGSRSGLLGVSWREQSSDWQARIHINGENTYIGRFATKELAHDAYIVAKREFHVGCTI